ncbi:MAG: glycine cleavage system protein GcvH [Spirochaetes bacterium]|nr:glycine cleavage system protein GcvH [Spirochaetota bacterium]
MKQYLESHEWAEKEGDLVVVGISDHAQSELSDVVFVDLPAVGKVLAAGKSFMAVESVKAASDIYAPVSGTITAVNAALKDNPEIVNQSAEKDGWLVKVKPSDPAELGKLLSEETYRKSLAH